MPKLELLHSVCRQEFAVSADGVEKWDLGVNPLSVVLLAVRPLNDTGTLANFNRAMGLALHTTMIRVLYRGQNVFAMSGRDALALAYFRHGAVPFVANGDDTDDERRCMVIPILLGRFAYDPHCCFPASRRGELEMEVTTDIAITGSDGLRLSCETIELLGAEPKEYERKSVVSKTHGATGLNDFDLPIGHDIRGLLAFGTTPFGGATPAPSLGRMELLRDNRQVGIMATDFEVAHQLHMLMGRQPPTGQGHSHRVTTDGNAQTALATNAGPHGEGLGGIYEQYCFLDLDPTRDDTFSVETAGANDLFLRINVETADACRVIPIERIKL